ncbi:MAG: hypothetical protein MR902_02465 [Campylobacter sp.]|nr:hypothetical protein [Campylobacter sp.]
MIKTSYKIELIIDDESFDLIVREPNLAEKIELENKTLEISKKLKEQESINETINLNSNLIKTNEALIRSDFKDKSKLLLENKELIKTNSKLKKELINLSDLYKDLEVAYAYRTSILIDGNKDRLFKTLTNKGISHEALWAEIAKEIESAKEKN